ncbi:MAG: ornithine carbamoyltransferase [Ilumatobacteraceae bacterium]
MRHLLTVTDLDAAEVATVLDLATSDDLRPVLARHGVALIFEKPSNRTRQSMEIAVAQLGGHPVYTRGEEVGFDVRETVEDVTRVMAGYHAVLAARVFDHGVVERMAAVSSVPVVNMLSDFAHPLQALADVLTMQQVHGPLDGRTVAWVGDYNNVARSLAECCVLVGANVSLCCPVGYSADEAEIERLNLLGDGSVRQTHRPVEAVAGAIAVHTDTWTSMGQETEKEQRKQAFEGFQVDEALMAAAEPAACFYHCLPAYRGVEVSADVIDGPHSRVIEQAHNRLHAARGMLAFLMGVR